MSTIIVANITFSRENKAIITIHKSVDEATFLPLIGVSIVKRPGSNRK